MKNDPEVNIPINVLTFYLRFQLFNNFFLTINAFFTK